MKRKPDWPIFSLTHPCLVISRWIRIRKKTKITVKIFNHVIKMVEPLPQALTLLKLKKTIKTLKSNKILARSSTISIQRWVTMLINVSIKSEKTSFGLDNLLINSFGQCESYFKKVLRFEFYVLVIDISLLERVLCIHYSI